MLANCTLPGVIEQSGIRAGGGFDVDFKGNADLKGAYRGSGCANVGKWAGPPGLNFLLPNTLGAIGGSVAGGSGPEAASAAKLTSQVVQISHCRSLPLCTSHMYQWRGKTPRYIGKSMTWLELAEAVRFELTEGLPLRWFSRPVH